MGPAPTMAIGEISVMVKNELQDTLSGPAAAGSPAQHARSVGELMETLGALLVGLSEGDYSPMLAARLHACGFTVDALCPDRHPLAFSGAVRRRHVPTWNRPAAIKAAIAADKPALVIPCDDAARYALTDLHARCVAEGESEVAAIIERSLGDPAHFRIAEEKSRVLAALDSAEVRMPRTRLINARADLEGAFAALSSPLVLKRDRTYGGQGVIVCRTLEEAAQGLQRLQKQSSARAALGRAFWERDLATLPAHFTQAPPVIVAQEYIEGGPANCVAACWKGEIVASLTVSVVEMNPRPMGPSTVVQIIENAEINHTVATVARQFGLSGVCGFDFVLQPKTGDAYFLELNPRATPTSHLGRSTHTDVARALARCFNKEIAEFDGAAQGDRSEPIALFPSEWVRDPNSPHLPSASIPWEDPAIIGAYAIDYALRSCESKGRFLSLADRLAIRHLQRRLRSSVTARQRAVDTAPAATDALVSNLSPSAPQRA